MMPYIVHWNLIMCNISLGIEARGEARGIEKTKTEILKETDENHIVGKKVKIMSSKKSF